jgi:hypothetical protein
LIETKVRSLRVPTDVKILSATRTYHFAPDEIDLEFVSTEAALRRISTALAIPDTTPGVILGSPTSNQFVGVEFQGGSIDTDEGETVPVRKVRISSRLIGIVVVGPSVLTDLAFTKIKESLLSMRAGGRRPVLGNHLETRDFSEIAAQLSFTCGRLFAHGFVDEIAGHLSAAVSGSTRELGLGIAAVVMRPEAHEVYPGDPQAGIASNWWRLSPRQGSRLSDRVYYSAAPFDTDGHVKFLGAVEDVLQDSSD